MFCVIVGPLDPHHTAMVDAAAEKTMLRRHRTGGRGMSELGFHELFPLGEDNTPYRKLTTDHVGTASFNGARVVTVAPEALTMLSRQAFIDCAHLLRPA